jgi:hypothetical protein
MAQLSNELYLMVMPTVSLTNGKVDQVLTLIGDRNLASEFFADEVEAVEMMFKNRLEYFSGGHVKSYEFTQETVDSGRIIVKVIQNVA